MTERELSDAFGVYAVDALRSQLDAGTSPQVDVEQLRADVAAKAPWVDVDKLLAAAVDVGWLSRVDTFRCKRCGSTLDDEFIAAGECPYCSADLTDPDLEPVPLVLYISLQPLSRSVPWLIAIHGFNTLGPWQETFSWLVAGLYRYPAPVLTYKYGLLRVGVLFQWRHFMLMKQLGARIRKAVVEAQAQGIADPPDVIAHSFGTQLFRLLLESKEFRDLSFGRVIMVGSIIRPDFDWSEQIEAGRVQAVLNQRGGRDMAVPWAQFTIPGTGPAGKHGFSDEKVINVAGERYGHSSALSHDKLNEVLRAGGAFERFLRLPLASYTSKACLAGPWKPAPIVVRLATRALAISLVAAVGLFCVAVMLVGTAHVVAAWM